MQYVIGLKALGHDVLFVEDSGEQPSCYNPDLSTNDADPSYGLRFAADAFAGCGIGEAWAYHDAPSSKWHGPAAGVVLEHCRNADLLINLCDADVLPHWIEQVPARAFIDTDPVFTQVKNLRNPSIRAAVLQHTALFTFGENIGSTTSAVPDDGLVWRPTRQPIDLHAWGRMGGHSRSARWTTIMQWDSYPPLTWNGTEYGMKSRSFAEYLDLPTRSGAGLEIALGSSTAPRPLLSGNGWHLRDPLEISRTPWTYRSYIQDSRAEFSVAKHGYVVSRSGWFSERSACYLASGRPVVVQETGFSRVLTSTGEGVVPFTTPEEALAGIESVELNYERHSDAARAIAEEFFDSQKVLSRLVEEAMTPSPIARQPTTE